MAVGSGEAYAQLLEDRFQQQSVLISAIKELSDGLILLLSGLIQEKGPSLKCFSAIDGEAVHDWLLEERRKT